MAGSERRSTRWGTETPATDNDARERLLAAADRCYAQRGVTRTRIDHIAEAAGVHRTTVYSYFPNKNALVSASFVRSARSILETAKDYFQTDEPFIEQLVAATLYSLDATRESPAMAMLLGGDAAGVTVHAATVSAEWHALARETLGPPLTRAVVDGHVRSDVPVESILRWIWRVSFSLAAEPGGSEDGGDEGVLRRFLVASVASSSGGGDDRTALS